MEKELWEVERDLNDEIFRLETRVKGLEEKLDYFLLNELTWRIDSRISIHLQDQNES